MIKKAITVIQRGIDGMSGFAVLTLEKIIGQGGKIARPEKTGIGSFQAEDAIKRVVLELRLVGQPRIKCM